MESIINEQSVKIFSDKLYQVLNYIVPGVFTLEIFFKKGIFSVPPNSIFEFILFLIWAFIFSLPFNLISTFRLDNVIKIIKSKIDKLETNDEIKIVSKEMEENHIDIESMVQFLSINIYLLFLYLTYKYLNSHYVYEVFWGISETVLIFLNTI